MADFRAEIRRLQAEHTKGELVDILADRLGERGTSVNPVTEAMFGGIAPGSRPMEYAKKSENYAGDLKPVAKNATALKILLHEQVGRPLYERVLTLKKRDFAECIVAVDAHADGYERVAGEHVPTTLPRGVDNFVSNPPTRTQSVESPFETVADFGDRYQEQIARWLQQNPETASCSHFVYVLDCTPGVGDDENRKVRNLRRAVQTKVEAGIERQNLDVRERAADALNDDRRVYYVGSTSDFGERVSQHVVGTSVSGVDFTTTLQPKRLVEVIGCDSRAAAERLEGEQANEIDSRADSFAYSDEM